MKGKNGFDRTFEDPAAVVKRMSDALGVDSRKALADALGVTRSAVNIAVSSKRIPLAWFFSVSERSGAQIDWLWHGECSDMEGRHGVYVSREWVRKVRNVMAMVEGTRKMLRVAADELDVKFAAEE